MDKNVMESSAEKTRNVLSAVPKYYQNYIKKHVVKNAKNSITKGQIDYMLEDDKYLLQIIEVEALERSFV